MQSIFKPLLSETDEDRCERFPLTPCASTFQNKETIHYNTTNCRAIFKSAALIPAQLGILEAN